MSDGAEIYGNVQVVQNVSGFSFPALSLTSEDIYIQKIDNFSLGDIPKITSDGSLQSSGISVSKFSEIDEINSRVDNIIAHNDDTEGNSELIDIRTGTDGTVYNSAGNAVRTQISAVKQAFSEKLTQKADIKDLCIPTATETSDYAKNNDFSVFSSFLADSNRYVSDYEITKECFLTALTVPTGAATACRIICGEVKNNVFTMHHDYGNFTITDGTALINDTRYVLRPGERLFVRLTGGYHYKAQNNDCIFLSESMVYSSTEHYIIGYDLLLTDAEDSLEWIHNCSDLIGSFRGKNYVAYGDSITAGYDLPGYDENRQFHNTSVNVYSKLLADDLKMNYYNFGYSAHGYSVTPNYTFATLIERHHTDADVVTVAMGTNDYGLAGTYNIPFGTISDTTTATFCGSVRASYDKLLEYYPKAEIIIILPLPRRNMSANAQGKTLYDYADVIKQIAGEYGFPVVDLLREGNVHHKSTVFMNEYSMDGLHWNESFHKEYIYPQLKNAVINHAIIK